MEAFVCELTAAKRCWLGVMAWFCLTKAAVLASTAAMASPFKGGVNIALFVQRPGLMEKGTQ